ncbi:MAG: undecaprenyldiphospho-muramoylpentapeptide beta-N-acetylglucosaminyltransferase [Desulfuromonadaceae bacterium]|nr:undecaprenyldiphospho-muramoylpentapeptide beta-N-acetylglucosaminyltransferase [Desulfuromonadaceae bacterium]
MRLLIAGGGTGGHVFPALALAEALRNEGKNDQVLFVGTNRGLEAKVVPERGFRLEMIDIRGFVGKSLGERMMFFWLLLKGVVRSLRLLAGFRPDLVLGVGGYASAPLLIAARLRGVPYVIHEQNAFPGGVNRIMGRWARRVCLSFADTAEYFPAGRTVVTGNPVREGIAACPPLPEGDPRLLVFGGSQGAQAINRMVTEALPLLEGLRGRLTIHHQTGSVELATVRESYRKAGWDAAGVVSFIDDMAEAYGQAWLVVCRAGATTVAELAASGRPAVLIPFPHAAKDHQTRNALALEQAAAALLLPQADGTAERLAATINELIGDRKRLLKMSEAMRNQARPKAAEAILRECRAVAAAGKE